MNNRFILVLCVLTAIIASALIVNAAPAPAVPPLQTCIEKEKTCVGSYQYECHGNQWLLKETNSPDCGYVSPTPPATKYLLVNDVSELSDLGFSYHIHAWSDPVNLGGKTITLTGGTATGGISWTTRDIVDGGFSTGSANAGGNVVINSNSDPSSVKRIPLPITSPITIENVQQIELEIYTTTPLYNPNINQNFKTNANYILQGVVTWVEY